MKWMMGWMHDTLDYFKVDPFYRKFFQISFPLVWLTITMKILFFLSAMMKCVHGKSPMIYKMPGDEWQKYANLRVLHTIYFTHPGGKLLFMGDEFGHTSEWNYTTELDWNLLRYEPHSKLKTFFKDLNHLFISHPAFYEYQFDRKGFEWVDLNRQERMRDGIHEKR